MNLTFRGGFAGFRIVSDDTKNCLLELEGIDEAIAEAIGVLG
jgi:hypothetical protein